MTVAALLAALAGWWAWAGPVRRSRARARPGLTRTVAAAGVLAVVVLVPAALTGLVVIAALAGTALGGLWRRRRGRLATSAVAAGVSEACARLAAQLEAGQPPGTALAELAQDCPVLVPAAEAFALGADVPTAFRDAAAAPGAERLRLLAAAWQVSHRTGAGLAHAVGQLAQALRDERSAQRLVDGELASARATARLVALLPVVALAMGSGAGGNPWAFLATTPAGLACLAAGLTLGIGGLWWIEALCGEAS